MSDELFRVVFSGSLIEGVSGKQALENLAQLFRKTPDEIRRIFTRPGTVVRSNMPLAKAEKMLAGLTRAGVRCQIQAMPGNTEPAAETPPSAKSQPAAGTAAGPHILTLAAAATDLTLAPINCGRLSAHEGGLETTRLDRSFIAYKDIQAAALFTPKESSINLQLLLFTAGHKRPILVEGMQIAFADFPDVAGANLPTSLRNFLRFLLAQNPALCLDEKSAGFISGAVPPLYRDEPVLLATALYNGMVASGQNLERKPASAPEPGTATAPKPIKPAAGQTQSVELAETADGPIRNIDLRADLDLWVGHWPLPIACALLAGFLLPLLKHSLLFDTVHLVWFWNLLGFGLGEQQVAAMATYSAGKWGEVYALLPAVSAVLALLTLFAVPKRWRGPVLFVGGLVPLSLAFTLFHSGGEIFGIIFLPATAAGGGMMLGLLLATLLLAAVNHLGKQAIVHPHLRILQGFSGLVLLAITILAFIAPDWNHFVLYMLYLLWLAIALLSLKDAITGSDASGGRALISLLLRAALVMTPIATIIGQSAYDNPYVTYVVESAGGLVPLIIASLKAYLIYYAMAIATGVGLVQMLGRFYSKR